MIKLSYIFLICAMVLGVSVAAIDDTPEVTILWNKFKELKTVGNFVVGLSDNGLTVLKWSIGQNGFVPVQYLILPSPAKSMKLQAAMLIVRHANDDLSFVNTLTPPPWERSGTVSPEGNYFDFAHVAGDLYLSRWFDGIDRYSVLSFQSLTFIENEKSAVVATQLESDLEHLYALDMYNGVLKYNLSLGIGSDVEKLLVNKRPFAFSLVRELVFISMNADGAILGKFNESAGEVIQEITGVPSPLKVLPAAGSLVFLSPREVHVIDAGFDLMHTYLLDSNLTDGDTITVDYEHFLLLPGKVSGITKFDLLIETNQEEVLYRSGPITSSVVYNDYLITGGNGNPLEMYEREGDSLLAPELLRGEMTGVTDLGISMNSFYAMYANEQKILVFDIANLDGLIEPIDSLTISIEDAAKLNLYNLSEKSIQILTAVGRNKIEVFSNTFDTFESVSLWAFDKPIVEVAILKSTLYVTDRFGGITAYEIQSDLTLFECAERDLTGTGWAMQEFNNRLFVFTGNTATVFSSCLELDTIVHLPSFVLDAATIGDTLFTVGPDGIAKYDLTNGLPSLIESGGLGGSQISVDNGVIVTTDGSSIHLYFENAPSADEDVIVAGAKSVTLYENYPEPFNAATTIQFELPSSYDINLSVYNLLGQRVRLLSDQRLSAGKYSISWDGRDETGMDVASGVYFYKLETESEIISRKMLLIK